MESKRTATTYFIPPGKFLLMENALGNPDLIQSSVSSDCRVTIVDSANFPLDELEQWPTFRLISADIKLKLGDGAYYIYIVVPTPENTESTSAFISYNTALVDRDGYQVIEATDEDGNPKVGKGELLGKSGFKYYQCGTISARGGNASATTTPSGQGRRIEMDLGVTPAPSTLPGGLNDFDKIFDLEKIDPSNINSWLLSILVTIKQMVVRVIRVTEVLIFGEGDSERRVENVAIAGDPEEECISDSILASTAWVNSVTDGKYLRKDQDDRSIGKIASDRGFEAGTYVKGMIGGAGSWIGADGYSEMSGLTLREFLEVPELRFNRVDVVSGELWNSIAFGLVEAVDEDNRICRIKLEANERCPLHIDDLCRGIFADFGDGVKDEKPDKNGFQKLYGFKTAYFTPTEILEDREGVFSFRYDLDPKTEIHPCSSMKFAVYGNKSDESRRASAYSTRTYKRYLNGVDDWKIDPDRHIYAQYGDLNGLTIGGVVMQGYGSFQSNAYFRGVQIQLPPEQMEELRGESAYSVVLSSNSDVVVLDSDGGMGGAYEQYNVVTGGDNVVSGGKNVVTSVFKLKTDVQVRKGSKALYYSAYESEGSYTLVIDPVGCEAVIMNGLVVVSKILDTVNCHVNIKVNCEGKATYNLRYRVAFVKDGKVGKDGEDTVAYRITPNLSTLGRTMTGTVDPESVTFSLHRHQGEKSALYPCLWVMEGRNSGYQSWNFVGTSTYPVESWTGLFSGGYKYYRIQATGSGNVLYDEKEMTVVSDGKSGSMARYRGEFVFYNQSEPYVYDEEYRDVVLYEGNVYQVYAYGSLVTDAPSVSANSDNDGKWQRANQFRFVAMDTALIDNANIAGFTFRRKKYINDSPVGVMRSQYGPICISSVSQDFVSGNEIGITINGSYTKYVKIRKFNQTAYELVPSIETIVRRKNSSGEWVYDVSSISCSIKKITEGGSTIVSSVSGYTLKYAKDSGIETSGSSVSTSGATSSITFVLYDSKNVEVERQSIPVLIEGDVSVKAVVDNETVCMLVNEDNEVVSGTPHRFKVSLWKGINEISITNISFSNTSNVEISNEYIEIDTESGALKCTNASITGEVNANEGTFRNIEIKNATMKNGLLEAELSSNAVDGYPGISWMYDKTEYARLGMWALNGQVSGVLKISNNSTLKELSKLTPGMLVLGGKKSGWVYPFDTIISYDSLIFRTEDSSYSSGMLIDASGRLLISSDYWPLESAVADGVVYVDGSGNLKVKNPNRI